jgi:hypothetical protein
MWPRPNANPGAAPARLARARVAAALLALLIAGCSADADFDNAVRANTAVAWDDYLRTHPDGPHAHEARERLAALVEDREWQRAHAADTADAYQRYLHGYPQGAHAHDALVAIANLNLAGAPSRDAPVAPAAAPPPAEAPRPAPGPATPALPARAPPAPVAAPAPAEAPAPQGYRVQLGAYGTSARADHAWRELQQRYPQLAPRTPLIAAARAADGSSVYRLQVAGLERPAAQALCAGLAANHDPCIVVPPPPAVAAPSR